MDYKIQFENGRDTLIVGRETPYGITKMPEGFDGNNFEIELTENLTDGATLNKSRIGSRTMTIEFSYKNYKDAQERLDFLEGFFSPKIKGMMTVNCQGRKRQIAYICENFENKQTSLYSPLDCLVQLKGAEGIFQSVTFGTTEISTWIGGLKFPFTLPFKLKQRGEPRVNIINNGHVETPVQIIFKGPAFNPTIKLLQTGEYIRVKRELTSDDTLYIDTTYGVNRVEVERGGIRENAFSAIDWQSDFFQLQVGDNLVEYTTENQIVPQSVEIRFRERYLGV